MDICRLFSEIIWSRVDLTKFFRGVDLNCWATCFELSDFQVKFVAHDSFLENGFLNGMTLRVFISPQKSLCFSFWKVIHANYSIFQETRHFKKFLKDFLWFENVDILIQWKRLSCWLYVTNSKLLMFLRIAIKGYQEGQRVDGHEIVFWSQRLS